MTTAYRLFNPQGFNAYNYVMNNPLKFTDPDGEEVQFKDEEEAKKVRDLIRAGLPKAQRNAVSYEKTKDGRIILTVDAKAAQNAGADSLLGRLNNAVTSPLVAQVGFVKQDEKFTVIKFGVKGEASLKEFGEETKDLGRTKEASHFFSITLFENTFDRSKRIYFQQLGLNSDIPGVSRILISTQQSTQSMTEAVFHETLAHFETGIKGDITGARTGQNAQHPGVNEDSAKIKNAVQLNLRQR
jgi:hypothetical protein